MIVIDEEEIIEEIHQTSNSDSSNEGSDIEIEKIPHFTALWSSANYFCSTWNSKTQLNSYKNKTCQDCKVYCDVFNRICMRRDNKNVNRFFHEGITIALSDQLINDNKGFYYNNIS